MRHIGNGEGHTVLVLTDAESRLIRDVLQTNAECSESPLAPRAVKAWASGVARATERMRAEEKAANKAKREREKG
ncbi:MAG TPA: hypothetical protein VJN18_35775 [Polyangiaceae bacterium]|nr:hypothetical protein [Polyangiaceae bacterium]